MKQIPITRSSMPSYEEYCDIIKELWSSRWLTNNGAIHERFRGQVAEYLGADGAELFTNGHMAIELSLQAMELTGEVITTPFTFASTTQAIVRSGLEPVFCDIDGDTFTMDASRIEELVTERTCAILPVHVYGIVCDVEGITRVADKHGLKVIYDAAHAFGVRYGERGIASFGDAACFSFHATKVFQSIEGGAVCFNSDALGAKLAQLKNFGLNGQEGAESIGTNAKMNEFCAAMGLCNLRHIDAEIGKREMIVRHYRERLEDIDGLKAAPIQKNVTPNYAYFPVVIDGDAFGASRDSVWEALRKKEIYARKYFYPLTSALECYGGRFDPSLTPKALRISSRVLTLPLYSDMSISEADRVCDALIGCSRR